MLLVLGFVFSIRIIARVFVDDTFLYNAVIVPYTHGVAAFSTFYLVACLFENKKPNRVVQSISNISFEIYLYHYMFCVGPLKMFGNDNAWVTNCFLILIVTFTIAVLANIAIKRLSCFYYRIKIIWGVKNDE